MSDPARVGITGCGPMGSGIAEVRARAGRDGVVVEEERAKTEVFARLDAVVERRDAVLATDTSSLPVIRPAAATSRPSQAIGLHSFHPAPRLPLVEPVPSLLTGEDTVRRAGPSPPRSSARRSCTPGTGRGSSSTPCSCRTC